MFPRLSFVLFQQQFDAIPMIFIFSSLFSSIDWDCYRALNWVKKQNNYENLVFSELWHNYMSYGDNNQLFDR